MKCEKSHHRAAAIISPMPQARHCVPALRALSPSVHGQEAATAEDMMLIFVLFKLKPGVSVDAYQDWARTRDLPSVRALPSINDFRIFQTVKRLGSSASPPFDYIEVMDTNDFELFLKDLRTPLLEEVAKEFEQWADDPLIITTAELSGA